MRNRGLYIIILGVVLGALMGASSGCRKTATLAKGGILKFSNDTLKFDTIFTQAGSYTNIMLIYNPQSEAVVVSSITLQNGAASYFHLNVDGFTGNTVTNLKIAAHDSAYVFATVDINPNDSLSPFLITDALVCVMNGSKFTVPFTAYGQNAHYIIGDSISAPVTNWLTDKPYVVIHNCIVAPNSVLNIPRGCRVYMHQDAQFIVYPYGTMNIGQTPAASTDSVVFQGDRLDRAYFGYIGYPGEWCGLWFTPVSNGNISNTVIKNCGGGAAYRQYTIIPAAIRADSGASVRLDHSVIKNSISLGILGFQGNVTATNCLVATTGGQALAVAQGGIDTFINCTFANYGTAQVSHASAVTVSVNDWYEDPNKHLYFGNLTALLQNCIVYGSLDSEMICDTSLSPAGIQANVQVTNCLLRMGNVREPFVHFTGTLFNKDPMFKNTANGDFHLSTGSPAIGTGASLPSGISNTNLDGMIWGTPPDIGCY